MPVKAGLVATREADGWPFDISNRIEVAALIAEPESSTKWSQARETSTKKLQPYGELRTITAIDEERITL